MDAGQWGPRESQFGASSVDGARDPRAEMAECRQSHKWKDVFNKMNAEPSGWRGQEGIHAGWAAGAQDFVTLVPSRRSTNPTPPCDTLSPH